MVARLIVAAIVAFGFVFAALGAALLQPQSSVAAPEPQVCVAVMVPDLSPLSPEAAAELKRTEAEIGKPILRETIGTQECFATDAEAQEYIQSLENADSPVTTSDATTNEVSSQASYVIAYLYEHADYNSVPERTPAILHVVAPL